MDDDPNELNSIAIQGHHQLIAILYFAEIASLNSVPLLWTVMVFKSVLAHKGKIFFETGWNWLVIITEKLAATS